MSSWPPVTASRPSGARATDHTAFACAVGLAPLLSLLHAALPNHWLPFVLVGRVLKWPRRKTLSLLALAGGGHVLATSALGLGVWALGEAALHRLAPEDIERYGEKVAGTLPVILGTVYLLLHTLGRHVHSHAKGEVIYGEEHAHAHEGEHEHHPSKLSEGGAILTLFRALTFSPCEAVVGAFLAGVRFGFGYVLILALGSSVATVLAMFVLTWLTLAGVERLRFAWLDRNEMSLTGALLVAIGILVLTLPT